MLKTKVKIMDGGKLPTKSNPNDACYDLYARRIEVNPDRGWAEVSLGVHFQPEQGYRVALYPRSSLSMSGWVLANSVGVGDQEYTGEYKAIFRAFPTRIADQRFLVYPLFPYKKGDRVLQMELLPWYDIEFHIVEELEETVRGKGGFGSTGK